MVTVSYLVDYDTSLQSATYIITKCDSYFIIKCDKILLQNVLGILLQNATVLVQNVTVITNYVDFITNCDSYCKMQRLLQNVSVHTHLLNTQVFVSISLEYFWNVKNSCISLHSCKGALM